jgi:Ion transport protein
MKRDSTLPKSPKTKTFALKMIEINMKKANTLKGGVTFTKMSELEGISLLCLENDSPIRFFTLSIIKSKPFEMFIMFLIVVSSILLALDNPLNAPNGTMSIFLYDADIILTSFFAIESALKIITLGFIFNGEGSYLKNGWNVIDFLVVIISIISLVITSNKLKIVKILRLLRVLRPLRVISRNKGLKIGIQALFMAVPSIGNVIIVSGLFFVIFGIIGVNYFKGTFFGCRFGDPFSPEWIDADGIVDKWDCLNWGGAWMNSDQTFDNVPSAMSMLFQMATTEGWIDMMNKGLDSVGIDQQPIKNQNIYWAMFFMLFIILGNFLILNLFVGVVVNTFNREKEKLGKNFLLTPNQKKWLEQKRLCMGITPMIVIDDHTSKFRQFFLKVV